MNTRTANDVVASPATSSRSWGAWMRQSHRWVSVAFTITVVVNFAALGQPEKIRNTVAYLPLIPLAVLFLSGAYLFALPYLAKRRRISS
jgi:hypothetical protein